MRRVPRLDETALKTMKRLMKEDTAFTSYVESMPVLKNVVQATEKTLRTRREKDAAFLLLRHVHLRLIQAVLSLLKEDPESIVDLNFPSFKLEITSYLDDQHRPVWVVGVHKKDLLEQESSFWNQKDFVKHVAGFLVKQSPRTIRVSHSAYPMPAAPMHSFLRMVGPVQQKIPRNFFTLYNEKLDE